MSIESLPLFQGIPRSHLEWAIKHFKPVRVNFGTRLIEEGDHDSSMVIVVNGKLEMSTGGVLLGNAGVGELVGEVALFGSGVRSASVETLTQCDLLILDRSGYITLRNQNSPIAYAIEEHALDAVSNRLRRVNKRISELAEGTPVEHVTPSQGFFSKVASIFGGGGLTAGPRGLDVAASLAETDLFKDSPEPALQELAGYFGTASAGPGTFVCTEGDVGGEMYILLEGHVDVLIDTEDDSVEPVARLQKGDAFGMCSLVQYDQRRMASCVASDSAVLLTMDRDSWSEVCHAMNAAGSIMRSAMIKALAEQLLYTNGQLATLDQARTLRPLTIDRLDPLKKASAALEARGRHLQE